MSELNLKIISWIGRGIVTVIGKSLRITNVGSPPEKASIWAFWHSDFFPLIYAHRFKKIAVLVSTHRDGEYLARILESMEYKTIRGSSAGEGTKAFLKLLNLNETHIGIAPDGPTGPAYYLKEGTVKIAELTKLPIVPIGISISKLIRLSSWDRFKVPIPFSRCVIYWGAPIWVKKSTKEMREKVESELIEANKKATQASETYFAQ